ncbi:MAG: TatD family hydrolase [Acidobacteriales bacterium]|nr:TatD family hydrolase [Candidatus Koribacter versatilis]MBI3645366.1 TatD family hydrolase [Terriglobales bacterium]
MFIDSHAHLEGKRYDSDRDAVLGRAKQSGIEAYLAIGNGDGPETADCGIHLAEKYSSRPEYPQIWASVGIHPHEASLANDAAYARLEQWARHQRVVAWGEIGLDYFYDHSPREVQKAVFLQQMELARAAKLPIIIHCRPSDNSENAWDDCLALTAEHWTSSGLGGILHCFTGTVGHARRGLDLGFMISFAGNITFPKAQSIREAAQLVPLDRMLIETDSPYLAPIPHRGQRNEPAFVKEVARQIGELRGMSAEEIGSQTAQNFCRFFKLSEKNESRGTRA